jgi:hypothetical protein
MILHCWYCSLGGERLSEDSAVAKVKRESLDVPVRPAMFGPLNGTGVPPFANTDWLYMKHMACGRYPWPQNHVLPINGPTHILTDSGLIEVKSAPKPPVTPKKKMDCPHCGKVFSSAGLHNHIKFKHPAEIVNG